MALLGGGEERWAPGQAVCAQPVCVPSTAPVTGTSGSIR